MALTGYWVECAYLPFGDPYTLSSPSLPPSLEPHSISGLLTGGQSGHGGQQPTLL